MEDRQSQEPGREDFTALGNPNKGASETLLKFPSGYHAGWHWHAAAYQTVVIQGRFTHTFNQGGASQTGGPVSVLSQPATQLAVDERVRDLPIAPEKPARGRSITPLGPIHRQRSTPCKRFKLTTLPHIAI
jgi:hypothetical protein